MTPVPPPQGISETDYETIEAAVTETVRGRWFLSEFARRNRSGEMRQLLDAIARLETTVTTSQAALPTMDPSVRMLIQRIKEVTANLTTLSGEMREAGSEERFIAAVEAQTRAVSGLVRGGPAVPAVPPRAERPKVTDSLASLPRELPAIPAAPARPVNEQPHAGAASSDADAQVADPRLKILSKLDALPFAQKLAFFR